jgi:hypothetical protein
MSLRLHYTHACGHTGIGPLTSGTSNQASSTSPDSPISEKLTTNHLELPFSCPYCQGRSGKSNLAMPEVPLGHGILTIISPMYPWSWCIIRSCRYEDVTPRDWAQSMSGNGGFRQIAWIPRPCGEVRVMGGLEEVGREGSVVIGVKTEVSCAWRQSAGEPVGTRFTGLLSQLNAAVLSGDRAGR